MEETSTNIVIDSSCGCCSAQYTQ